MSDLSFSEMQELYREYSPLKSEQTLLDILYRINAKAYYNLNNVSARDFITTSLYNYYPNEAALKSAFINKMLSKETSAISLFEFPIGKSRVDLCRINGTSYAYEIKTDLDNLSRLDKQLSDYKKVFEYTYVICSNNRLEEVQSAISNDIGIIYYTHKNDNYFFHTHKSPQLSTSLSPKAQILSLSNNELDYIICKYHLAKNASIEEIIAQLSAQQINKGFKTAIKKRYQNQWFFLKKHKNEIANVDYQFFFKKCIDPSKIYQ